MTALKAWPQPPDMSSMLMCVSCNDCRNLSVSDSGVIGVDDWADIEAAWVSVGAAIGVVERGWGFVVKLREKEGG